jgi:hypothetical protein
MKKKKKKKKQLTKKWMKNMTLNPRIYKEKEERRKKNKVINMFTPDSKNSTFA